MHKKLAEKRARKVIQNFSPFKEFKKRIDSFDISQSDEKRELENIMNDPAKYYITEEKDHVATKTGTVIVLVRYLENLSEEVEEVDPQDFVD